VLGQKHKNMKKMRLISIILFAIGLVVWFLAGFSIADRPFIRPIYGQTFQAISFFVAIFAMIVFIFGYLRAKRI